MHIGTKEVSQQQSFHGLTVMLSNMLAVDNIKHNERERIDAGHLTFLPYPSALCSRCSSV